MSWIEATIGDLVRLQRGHDLTDAERKPGTVPVIGSAGQNGFHSVFRMNGPGVTMGRSGGSIGKITFVKEDYWPHNTCIYVTDFKGNDPRFVAYFLQTKDLAQLNSGSAQPSLNRNFVYTVKIKYPAPATQRRIAGILSAYDDLIDNNRKRITLLEKGARLLYEEWFVRLQFPGHEHTPVVDGVPEGWKIIKVEELGDIITGKTPDTKKGNYYGQDVPFIKTPDMHGNVYVTNCGTHLSKEGADTQPKKYLPPNSILVSCIGTVGVVSLTHQVSQTNQQINAVVIKNKLATYFAYFTLEAFKSRLEAIGGGATMPNVNKSKFGSLELLMPNEMLLKAFYDFCLPLFSQIINLQLQTQKLQQARDLLLPRLMSGELAV